MKKPNIYKKLVDEGHVDKILKGMNPQQQAEVRQCTQHILNNFETGFIKLKEAINNNEDLDTVIQAWEDVIKTVGEPTQTPETEEGNKENGER